MYQSLERILHFPAALHAGSSIHNKPDSLPIGWVKPLIVQAITGFYLVNWWYGSCIGIPGLLGVRIRSELAVSMFGAREQRDQFIVLIEYSILTSSDVVVKLVYVESTIPLPIDHNRRTMSLVTMVSNEEDPMSHRTGCMPLGSYCLGSSTRIAEENL
ncbi:hypothetical protein CYLTODRAFT_413208 [Cylindrobasidium torrendii FP15055 ss-10]|uniref:Uncharacterized protein n=1 Tax=Cylindrobasidium torrendii FP15055 ss-10 TaxID=1314674 RepID=A0A0D7B1T7_9AGAR|nr:hypothetical protein CYLTODRAFT_413208 [Cylindrobasidium torrendii FP15055 ss-10]